MLFRSRAREKLLKASINFFSALFFFLVFTQTDTWDVQTIAVVLPLAPDERMWLKRRTCVVCCIQRRPWLRLATDYAKQDINSSEPFQLNNLKPFRKVVQKRKNNIRIAF